MQQFRRFVRGPVGKVLLALIILPFVISGFYGYFSSSGSQGAVAEVEGSKITDSYVKERTQRLRQMIRQQSPNVTPAMLDAFVRPRMVLEGIINEQLVAAAADKAGMAYSDVQAAKLIRANPAFEENGQFSEPRFESLVRTQGMTPRGYLNGLRQDHLSQQYREGLRATGFALPDELDADLRLLNQTRDLSYAILDVDTLKKQETASDDQVKAFYKAHQSEFIRPEQYKVRYLELTSADFAAQAKVTDAQIQKEYKARKEMRESSSTRREVADILIAVNDKRSEKEALARAQQARKELDAGKSFAEVAHSYSDDASTASNGGDLGMLSKGTLPPKLEAALDTLKVGEVSQPVVADSGVHLLRIVREDKQTMPPLKQVKDQIAADLEKSQEQTLLSEAVSKLEELVYEHTDLQEPAAELNLKVQSTDWTGLDDLPKALNDAKVRDALQSDSVAKQGHNSDLLEVGKGHYVVVHLAGTKPPEPKPIAEVSDDIRAQLKQQAALKHIKSIEQKARTAVKDQGANLEAVAKVMGAQVQSDANVARRAQKPAKALIDAAFGAPSPKDGKPAPVQFVSLSNGSLAAYQVTKVTEGSTKMTDDQRKQALNQLAQSEGQQSYQLVMQYLRETLDVTVHADRLKSDQPQDDSGQ